MRYKSALNTRIYKRKEICSLDEFVEPTLHEHFNCLSDAKIIWLDEEYTASLFGVESIGETDIAELVGQTAIISQVQSGKNCVNDAVSTLQRTVPGVRPHLYGRACVVEVSLADQKRLIDVKGVGVRKGQLPSRALHKSGVLVIHEALEELIMQVVVERVMDHAGIDVYTLPVLGLLDAGYKAQYKSEKPVPAVILLRRGHIRPPMNIEIDEYGDKRQQFKIMLELILRSYGVTSSHPENQFVIDYDNSELYARRSSVVFKENEREIWEFLSSIGTEPPFRADWINLQMVKEFDLEQLQGELVDFGHYYVRDKFEDPLISLASGKMFDVGGIFFPNSPDWVQPEHQTDASAFDSEALLPKHIRSWIGIEAEHLPRIQTVALQIAFEICHGELELHKTDLPNRIWQVSSEFISDLV